MLHLDKQEDQIFAFGEFMTGQFYQGILSIPGIAGYK